MKKFVKASNMSLNFNEKSTAMKWMYKLFKALFKTPMFIFTKPFYRSVAVRDSLSR